MRLRDLGPPRVEVEGVEHAIVGAKQAAIISLLAASANERVPIDDIVVAAWGYDERVSASTVENHIWRLRRVLEPGRSRTAPSVLINEAGGYRLLADAATLDSLAFAELVGRARRCAEDGDHRGVLRAAEQASALWSGHAYESIAHVTAGAAAAARLEELRGQLAERRVAALLASGRVDDALAELGPLIAAFPFREQLHAQRMAALRRAGRTEEALASFHEARAMMLEELGIEPGAVLREAQAALLVDDSAGPAGSVPSLPAQRGDDRPSAAAPLGPVRLPARLGALVGRERELAVLVGELRAGQSATLVGPGGCGKTRLAVEAAAAVHPDFPDGVTFVDLTEIADHGLVPDAVVSALGIGVSAGSALDTLADFAESRRMLIVLDNCEHVLDGAAHAFDALAGSGNDGGAAVLATSREPLDAAAETVRELAPLSLEPAADGTQDRSAAAQLLVARLSGAGALDAADLGAADEATIQRICAAVDGLPLAIELAAARARAFSLDEVAEQVVGDPGRLSRIGRGPVDHRGTVRSMIEWSHRLLAPAEQAVHRRLAVLPGAFTLPVATAVAQGSDLDVFDVADALARLNRRSLLVVAPNGRRGGPSSFRQLDTVRAHARNKLAEAGEEAAAERGRDDWVASLLSARPRVGEPAARAWYDSVDDNYPIIRAALTNAVERDDLSTLRLGCGLFFYWYFRGRSVEGHQWARSVVQALDERYAGPAEPPEATLLRLLPVGTGLLSGAADDAGAALDRALALVPSVPAQYAIDLAETLTGAGDAAWARNDYELAARIADALGGLADRVTDPAVTLLAAQVDCSAGIASRDPADTAARAEANYAAAVEQGNLWVQWTSCGARMIAAALSGDPIAGLEWIDRLIPAHIVFGTGGGGAFLEGIGNFSTLAGNAEQAIRMYGAAHAEIRRVGMVWPIQINTLELLDVARSSLPQRRFDALWAEGSALTYADVARERGLLPAV